MHEFDQEAEDLIQSVFRYALDRIKHEPPLDGPLSEAELTALVGETITPEGLGGAEALRRYTEHLAPACTSADHPRYLAFIPGAPTKAAAVFDLVVGASSLCGSTWLDGAGMVFAENQALRWIADLAGMPDSAGGCFATGGARGHPSAPAAAPPFAGGNRGGGGPGWGARRGGGRPGRGRGPLARPQPGAG